MKKIFSLIIIGCALFLFTDSVKADTFSASIVGDDTFSNTITLKVKVNSLTGFSSGLYGIDARLDYDTTKLELVSITGLGTFDVTYDIAVSNRIVAYSHEGAGINEEILSLIFKKKTMSVLDSVTVGFTDVLGSDGELDISGTIDSKTITLEESEQMLGDLNNNEKIDLQDVILALKYYLGALDMTPEVEAIVDMDQNGSFNLKDIISLLRTYLGLE